MPDRGRRAAKLRLRVGVCGRGGSAASGGQVSTDASLGRPRDGSGLSGARHRTRSRCRGEDPGREVSAAVDGFEAGGVDHGAGGPSGGCPDLRRRVLVRSPVPGRRVFCPAARWPTGFARNRSRRRRRSPSRSVSRRHWPVAPGRVSARGRQAEQHRVHGRRVAQAAGLRTGAAAGRRQGRWRHAALPVSGGAGAGGRGGERCLVVVRGSGRDGVG